MEYEDPRRMYPINFSDGTHAGVSHLGNMTHGAQSVHVQSVVTLPQMAPVHQFQQQIQHTLLHAPAQQSHHHHAHVQQIQCQSTTIATQHLQHLQTTSSPQHQTMQSNVTNLIGGHNMAIEPTSDHRSTAVATVALPTEAVVDVLEMPVSQDANWSKCLLCNESFNALKGNEMINAKETILTMTHRSLREVLALVVGEKVCQNLGNELCGQCFYDLEKIDLMQHNLLNAKLQIIDICRNTLEQLKIEEEIQFPDHQIERLVTTNEEEITEDDLPSDIEMQDDPNDPDVTLASLKLTKKKKNPKQTKKLSSSGKKRTNKRPRGRPKRVEKESEEVPEGEDAINCPCCQKIIHANRYLKHLSIHKVFPCPFCSNIFREKDIKHHVAEEHQKEIEFPCSSCNLSFATFTILKRHCLEVHCGKKREKSKCDICAKTFSSYGALKVHLETIHDNAQSVKCPVCKDTFNQKGNMRNHFRRVHEGNQAKKLQCLTCGKGFVCPSELRKHFEKVHLKVKKTDAVCPICSKQFAEERSLKVHVNAVHTKEIKYPCSECKMVFNSLTNMITHRRRMHAGAEGRKHLCTICSKRFCSPSDLRNHTKVVHENVRKFVCDLCGQRFKVGSHLKYHRRRHTGEAPYKCPHCTKCFHGPSHISDHVKKVHRTVYMGVNQRRKLNLPDDAPPPPPGILPSKDSKGTIILTTEPQEPSQLTQILIPQQTQQHIGGTQVQHILPFGASNMISTPAMMDQQNHYAQLDPVNHTSSVPMVVRFLHDSNY